MRPIPVRCASARPLKLLGIALALGVLWASVSDGAFARSLVPSSVDETTERGNSPCEPGQDNRASDLCAQWKAADAASVAARWAAPVGIATWIGIFLGGGTLVAAGFAARYAKEAADHTADGAKAAWATEKHARESSERQLRAYVGVESANYDLKMADEGKYGFGVAVVFKNFGQTPAYKYRTLLALNHVSLPLEGEPDHNPDGPTHTLFPSMTSGAQLGIALQSPTVEALFAGRLGILISAVCTFEDAFGVSRKTEVRYLLKEGCPNFRHEPHAATLTFLSGSTN